MEELIKSKKRVQQHGEVFTPSWMVEKMLDTPGIKEACQTIHATFLEPSAGDGNFLAAILERKLAAVLEQFTDDKVRKIQSLWALASLYGIEFLADNVELARDRLFVLYLNWYEKHFQEALKPRSDIAQSVRYIIQRNVVRGNTLTKRHPDTNELIMMVEWEVANTSETRVLPKPFAFASLFGEDVQGESGVVEGQLSLFDDEPIEVEVETLQAVYIEKVYQVGERLW